MLNIIPREYEGQSIRMQQDEHGALWWVAKDVCDILDIGNPSQALTRLEADEKGIISTDTDGGIQDLTAVTEAGLYTLILGSRKPQARGFKRWVTHDVIPEIRKTGGYGNPVANLSRKELLQMALATEEENERLKLQTDAQHKEIKLLTPKAEIYDDFMDSKDAINLTSFAKVLGLKPNKTIQKLRTMGILYKRNGGSNLAKQEYLNRGYFTTREKVQGDKLFVTTLVTPKGQEWLAKKVLKVEEKAG